MDYTNQILEKLMYNSELRFTDMQIEGITSKHFNYYLKKLIAEDYIIKIDRLYHLTNKGKELVGRFDEIKLQIEKQPKVSVAIIALRHNKSGELELLLNKRLKQPYYGKVGGFTGKIRFGESFEEAAKRELYEEAGLSGDFKLAHIKRKFAYKSTQGDNQIVQDQIMVFFRVTNIHGNLISKTKESENFWQSYDEVIKRKDLFNTFLYFLEESLNKEQENIELYVEAEGY